MARMTFVGVVYNNATDTADFCRSVLEMTSEACEISCVLVDNSDRADVQQQIDALSREAEIVTVLRPPKNLGYFGAFNYFFASDLFKTDSVVVLCNNDLVFDRSFCVQFLRTEYPDDALVICPDVITVDGVHQNPHVSEPWSRLERLKLDLYFTHYYVARALKRVQALGRRLFGRRVRMFPSPSGFLYMGIGACYILRKAFLSMSAKLDYPHFIYGEEAYLTRQVHAMGGRLYYDPLLKVQHKESATLSKLPSRVTYEYGREGYWKYRSFY